MEFSWSETERALFDRVANFAKDSLCDDTAQRDRDGNFSPELWQRCAREGVIGWSTPQSLGGAGHSPLSCAYLLEALGYGCDDCGLLFALGTQMWGVQSCLLQFATDEQQQRYIPAMLAGNAIGAYAINEPDSGSDAYALQTTAVEDGACYELNGTKTLISMSAIADFAIVFAVTSPTAGRWGLSAFIVETDTPGFKACEAHDLMGLRTTPVGDITLEACRVPKSAMLGKPGAGASIFGYSQSWERSLMLAPHVGTMQRLLDQSIIHCKSTRRAGKPIGVNQAISHRLADMRIRLETSRLLLYKTAWLLDQRKQNLMEAAISKTHISEAFVKSSTDAIALFGGTGYLAQSGVERNLRDAIGGTIYGGTVDVQRNIIAGLLGL